MFFLGDKAKAIADFFVRLGYQPGDDLAVVVQRHQLAVVVTPKGASDRGDFAKLRRGVLGLDDFNYIKFTPFG